MAVRTGNRIRKKTKRIEKYDNTMWGGFINVVCITGIISPYRPLLYLQNKDIIISNKDIIYYVDCAHLWYTERRTPKWLCDGTYLAKVSWSS